MKKLILLSVVISFCITQRSPYSGKRPIGYPSIGPNSDAHTLAIGSNNGGSTTAMKIPLEALGDEELVKKLSKLPIEHQPFWLLNAQALEEQRKNPKTYPQKENTFIDHI